MAKWWRVLKLGAGTGGFTPPLSACVCACVHTYVNFCDKSFFLKETISQRIKQVRQAGWWKMQPLPTESLNACPHLPQPWGLREDKHGSHEGVQCHWSLQHGLVGVWELTGSEQLCWTRNPQARLGKLSDWGEGMEASRIYSGRGEGEDPSLTLASSLTSFPEQIANKYQQNHAVWNSVTHCWQYARARNPQNCRWLA